MWVTYTFLLTYIIILGAHAACSNTELEPQCPRTLVLPCFSVLLELAPVPMPVLALMPVLVPVPHSPLHANGGSCVSRALPSPGARRLNCAMQMLSLRVGDLLGLPWRPALIRQTFIQPYGIKDYL